MDTQQSPLKQRSLPLASQLRVVGLAALAAGGALALVWSTLRARSFEPPQPSSSQVAAPGTVRLSATQLATLETAKVSTRAFRSEEITDGQITLNGDTATEVFTPFSGRVLRVMAEPGETVKQGQPLLEVGASEFVSAQSDLLTATAALKLARATESRKHAAFDSKGGSLADWQQAQAELAAAQTQVEAARNRLRIYGQSDSQIAALEDQRTTEARTFVRAPISGVITDRQVGPGQFLQAGSTTPLFMLGDLSTVWLVAAVPERDAVRVQRGQAIEVRVLALPGKVFTATLTSVGAQVDPVTRRVAVRATLPNPDGQLKPQMFATFSIFTSEAGKAPAVPEEAVVREGDDARVWVLLPDHALTSRPIKTGRSNDGMVEVLSGLTAGEQIVTRGSLFVDRAARAG